jgi:hypothetical protein
MQFMREARYGKRLSQHYSLSSFALGTAPMRARDDL